LGKSGVFTGAGLVISGISSGEIRSENAKLKVLCTCLKDCQFLSIIEVMNPRKQKTF
jgi:hypothetical protein